MQHTGTRTVCKTVPVQKTRKVCQDQGHWEERAVESGCNSCGSAQLVAAVLLPAVVVLRLQAAAVQSLQLAAVAVLPAPAVLLLQAAAVAQRPLRFGFQHG